MATANTLIEGAYLRDLLDQARSLRLTRQQAFPAKIATYSEALANMNPPSVVLTGMGSSFHALHPLSVRLASRGIPSSMVETSELIYYREKLLTSSSLVIAVSQSGRSAEIVRLLQLNQGKAPIIAVTNDPASPLAQDASHTVLIRAGEESTVSCKTYLCTLLALERIGAALCGVKEDDAAMDTIADKVEAYFEDWRSHVDCATEHLRGIRNLILAGRGASLATAGTGGLIIKEAARFPAEGMSAAAFRHGPLEMVSPELLLLVMQGDQRVRALNERLAQEVNDVGGCVGLVAASHPEPLFRIGDTTDGFRPILEMLPVQMFSLALAARDGHEAGAFARARKITDIE